MSESDIDFYCRLLARIKSDPEFFFENLIKVKNKEGVLVPFVLNPAQKKVFSVFLKQYRETGRVRIIVAKARQQGISTLCRALCLWYMIVCFADGGIKGTIIAQRERDLREKIFSEFKAITKHALSALPFIQDKEPKNSTGLTLGFGSDVSRTVGAWAKTSGGNRGGTYQFAFLTEVDSFPKWHEFWAGFSPSVPDGRSVFLIESTCQGRGAVWQLYQGADKGRFELVFLAWFEQPEYAIEGDEPLVLTEEQKVIQKKYNLTDAQMRWYAAKEEQFGSSVMMKWEYPSCLEDCFSIENDCSFFGVDIIEKASRRQNPDGAYVTVLGIDPSKTHDNTALVWRKGLNVVRIRNLPPLGGTVPLVQKVVEELHAFPADEIFIDAAGSSLGEYLLKDYGIRGTSINFGSSADQNDLYANKRAEMYARAARWLERHGGSISNDTEFKKQLGQIKYIPGKPRLQLMDKSLLPKSPDIADAFALTFAGGFEDWINIPRFTVSMEMPKEKPAPDYNLPWGY